MRFSASWLALQNPKKAQKYISFADGLQTDWLPIRQTTAASSDACERNRRSVTSLSVEKTQILREIRRTATANGGSPLGEARFSAETGIMRTDWFGVHWATWGDAVREAGFVPNKLNAAFDADLLLQKYAELTVELRRLPTHGQLRLKRRAGSDFPSCNTFARFGTKTELVKTLLEYCRSRPEFDYVAEQCNDYLRLNSIQSDETNPHTNTIVVGHVYMLKHGSRREYKIGRTNNRIRREGEIGVELPEKVQSIHVIETDDPAGVEAYWHRRFAEKRLNNEWFSLTAEDVRAFRRWRRIH